MVCWRRKWSAVAVASVANRGTGVTSNKTGMESVNGEASNGKQVCVTVTVTVSPRPRL
jgi:hypothetical protein